MAKKKKKTSGLAFWAPKKKKKKTKAQIRAAKEANLNRIRIFLVTFAAALVSAAVCVGFFYLEKYVKRVSPVAQREGPLVFPHDNIPEWFNEELAGLLRETAGGSVFDLNEDSAKAVGERLITLKWIEDLKVQTTKDSLRVTAKYRKPIASITLGGKEFCLAFNEADKKLAAMPYLNISKLPIVKITGSTLDRIEDLNVQEDIDTAVKLIILMSTMDEEIHNSIEEENKKRTLEGIEEKLEFIPPLLNDIAKIDVDNYDGRKNRSKSESHINIHTKDGKMIYWGNALGKTTGNFEATDEEKLSKLYDFFTRDKKNTLLNRNINYIDLR